MSQDDYVYEDPEKLFQEWLNKPYGRFSLMAEYIPKDDLPFVKEAFMKGYESGFQAKKVQNWKQQMQK